MNLYLTADKLGEWTGGSQVVTNESKALQELGPCEVWDRSALVGGSDPWGWSKIVLDKLRGKELPKFCHIYAGCFTGTVDFLQASGCKVCYTVAAHDVNRSRQAHLDLGLDFPYEHLTDPDLFQEYIGGYLNADLVICPSSVAAETVRRQGRKGPIKVIPHGIDLPKCKSCSGTGEIIFALDDGSDGYQETEHDQCDDCLGTGLVPLKSLPQTFTIGYLGSYGADKGVKTFLEAWKRLNYSDAVLLLGGRDSTSPFVQDMIRRWGGGNVVLAGWQNNPWDFMDKISCYVQPSATEGFGIEVLEAMARGRPVICSDQAGAVDLITADCGWQFKAGDVGALASAINLFRLQGELDICGQKTAEKAKRYTWQNIRQQYQAAWKELFA